MWPIECDVGFFYTLTGFLLLLPFSSFLKINIPKVQFELEW